MVVDVGGSVEIVAELRFFLRRTPSKSTIEAHLRRTPVKNSIEERNGRTPVKSTIEKRQ
jgi:hypothetical protein